MTTASGEIEIWPGASHSCLASLSGNGSEGVVYGGENFGPVVVALKDAAYRTTIAGAKISDHSSALRPSHSLDSSLHCDYCYTSSNTQGKV